MHDKWAINKYIKALKVEESFLKKKGRVNWLNLGGDNNAFSLERREEKE